MSKHNLFIYGDQKVDIPTHVNFSKHVLDRLRVQKGDNVALENALTEEKLTYKEFTQFAVDLASSLREAGVKAGLTVVGIGSERRLRIAPAALAVLFTGAAYVTYDIDSGRATLKHKLELAKPEYFICSKSFWSTFKDILTEADSIKLFLCFDESEDMASLKTFMKEVDVASFEPGAVQGERDTAMIMYSSGTTGMPKGVKLTHLNCFLHTWSPDFDDDSLDTVYICGEWFHGYDTMTTYKLLTLGRRMVYVDDITPENILKAIHKCQVNVATLVPSLVAYLAQTELVEQYDLSALKKVISRAARLHAKTIETFQNRFPTVRDVSQLYGMTETGIITAESYETKGRKIGSVGMVQPEITVKVVDPNTREPLGPNQRGEICVRGPGLMKGYIGVDPSTYLDDEGFFPTGDLGYYDEDKYFYIEDRLKEIIFWDGYKVPPSELEAILQLHPGVKEAGVVGRPAGVVDEEPVAFVVRRPGATVSEKELIDFVAAEVPSYMELRGGVVFIPKLPRNPTGKILRRNLKEMFNKN